MCTHIICNLNPQCVGRRRIFVQVYTCIHTQYAYYNIYNYIRRDLVYIYIYCAVYYTYNTLSIRGPSIFVKCVSCVRIYNYTIYIQYILTLYILLLYIGIPRRIRRNHKETRKFCYFPYIPTSIVLLYINWNSDSERLNGIPSIGAILV